LPRQDVPKYDKEFVILWLFVVFLGAMSIVTPEPLKGIIIPAHASNFIKPNGRFKMISTVIKSGYE
jgi:hypothetical protein